MKNLLIVPKSKLDQRELNVELYTIDDLIEIDEEFYGELSKYLHKIEPRSEIVAEIINWVAKTYHNLWKGVKTDIGERKKVCRSLDGINIYKILSKKEIPKEVYKLLLRTMLTTDIAINVTDDLVDNLRRDSKREYLIMSLTYVALMSHFVYQMIFDFISTQRNIFKLLKFYNALNRAKNVMYQSLLILPLIPLEEEKVYNKIVSNKLLKEEIIIEELMKLYMMRGEDIKFFVYLPLTFADYPYTNEVVKIAIIFRALQLLSKDKRDLQWDLYHKTPSPLVSLYLTDMDEKTREEIVNAVEKKLRDMLDSHLKYLSQKVEKERIEILREYLYQRIENI